MKSQLKIILVMTMLTAMTATAKADQAAVVTCTGVNVILTSETPYLGEDSKFTQTLWTLNSKDVSGPKVFFLNTSEEGAAGKEITIGKNGKGGRFELEVYHWQDVGDGSIINEITSGTLTYHHGAMNGKDEKVNCTRN